jgi:hypothetical protein
MGITCPASYGCVNFVGEQPYMASFFVPSHPGACLPFSPPAARGGGNPRELKSVSVTPMTALSAPIVLFSVRFRTTNISRRASLRPQARYA